MVALFRRIHRLEHFVQKRDDIRHRVAELLASPQKLELLTGKANTAQSIKDRINEIGAILDGIA
jgi:flagellar basal body-associated protein FliL